LPLPGTEPLSPRRPVPLPETILTELPGSLVHSVTSNLLTEPVAERDFSKVLAKSRSGSRAGGGGGVVKTFVIEYIHPAPSYVMHSHNSQHGTRVQNVLLLKSQEI
jgi:hypothetical protein